MNGCRVGLSAFQDQDLGLMDRPKLLGGFYEDTLLAHLFSCGSVRQEASQHGVRGAGVPAVSSCPHVGAPLPHGLR